VVFDVAIDVQAGLGPADTTFMSWLVRKPSGPGVASYYSREGTDSLGNPGLAPQIIITVSP
jgi:hypothetical protein